MEIRSILRPFDHPLGLRRSCSEEWSGLGGCGWFDLIVGRPCSPLSRLISSRRRWFSAWATRRSVMTSSSRLSSCLTSSRARSSAMLCRSRSSSMLSLAPGKGDCAYQKLLCSLSSTVATCLGACCHAQIIEEIQFYRHFDSKAQLISEASAAAFDTALDALAATAAGKRGRAGRKAVAAQYLS